jgi:hypothetical protein
VNFSWLFRHLEQQKQCRARDIDQLLGNLRHGQDDAKVQTDDDG